MDITDKHIVNGFGVTPSGSIASKSRAVHFSFSGRDPRMFTSMKYASKAMVIYMEAKNNGGFDEVTRAKLMKLARKYQMEDPLHENVYDIIRKFDECINILNIGIHYF